MEPDHEPDVLLGHGCPSRFPRPQFLQRLGDGAGSTRGSSGGGGRRRCGRCRPRGPERDERCGATHGRPRDDGRPRNDGWPVRTFGPRACRDLLRRKRAGTGSVRSNLHGHNPYGGDDRGGDLEGQLLGLHRTLSGHVGDRSRGRRSDPKLERRGIGKAPQGTGRRRVRRAELRRRIHLTHRGRGR